MQESLVGQAAEGIEVKLLVGYPVRIHSPQHPLRSHLEESTAAPCLASTVGHNLELETMSQFVSQAVEFLVLYAVRRYLERPDKVIVSATVSRAFQ